MKFIPFFLIAILLFSACKTEVPAVQASVQQFFPGAPGSQPSTEYTISMKALADEITIDSVFAGKNGVGGWFKPKAVQKGDSSVLHFTQVGEGRDRDDHVIYSAKPKLEKFPAMLTDEAQKLNINTERKYVALIIGRYGKQKFNKTVEFKVSQPIYAP